MLVERLRTALPAIPVAGATLIESYDGYYYGRGHDRPPLPVVRIRFADPLETWIYVDPAVGRIMLNVHRYSRLERWLFNGLHSLDFTFWYGRRLRLSAAGLSPVTAPSVPPLQPPPAPPCSAQSR